jgi:hypothetical protein
MWLWMLREAAQGGKNTTLIWYQCVLQLGPSATRCQALAGNIINLKLIWSAELIMALLGFKTFLIEASSRYILPSPSNHRQWWLGWRDLFVDLTNEVRNMTFPPPRLVEYYRKIPSIQIPRIVRVHRLGTSEVIPPRPAPRMAVIDLNRDLPALPKKERLSSGSTSPTMPGPVS